MLIILIMENQKSSQRPNNKPISKYIYFSEKRRGFPVFIVRPYHNQKENTKRFDNLKEAIKYRDELEKIRLLNKSILPQRKNKNTLPNRAEMIEKFIALGMTAGEIAKEHGIHESGMNAILNEYYKPIDGVEIIIQSKINGIEDPDKIKNITFL